MTQSDIISCNLSLCAWCDMQDHGGREREGHTRSWRPRERFVVTYRIMEAERDGHTRSWMQRERFVVTYRIMEAERESVVDRAISGVMCRWAELFM